MVRKDRFRASAVESADLLLWHGVPQRRHRRARAALRRPSDRPPHAKRLLHLQAEPRLISFRIVTAFLSAALLCVGCAHVVPSNSPTPTRIATYSRVDTLQVEAPGIASVPLRVRVYLPSDYDAKVAIGYRVLYVNDGQDAEAVGLQPTLAALYAEGTIRPVIVVAIDMPPDRMGAYGLSDRAQSRSTLAQTKYGAVGSLAHAYSEWLAKTLVPLIDD